MKKITVILSFMFIAGTICPSANAGLVNGAAKGLGKATKSVCGCIDRGIKGVGKGVKTCFGCVGKGFKTVL